MKIVRFIIAPMPRRIFGALCAVLAFCCLVSPNAALAAPGTITIIKHVVGATNDPQDFKFNSNASAIGTFLLDDDNDPTLPNTRAFTLPPPPTGFTYQVTEFATSGWNLTSITCTGGTANVSLANRTVTIPTLAAGQHITCTFTNTKVLASCTVYPLVANVYVNPNAGTQFTPTTVNICHGGKVKFINQGLVAHTVKAVNPVNSFLNVSLGSPMNSAGLTSAISSPGTYHFQVLPNSMQGTIIVH